MNRVWRAVRDRRFARASRAQRVWWCAVPVFGSLLWGACRSEDVESKRETVATVTGAAPAVPVDSSPVHFLVDTLARQLEIPWALAELPDGRWLVTERGGTIRVVTPGDTIVPVWARLDVYASEPGIGPETGLMGIALAPDFATARAVYVSATTWRTGGDRSRQLSTRLWRRLAGVFDAMAALRHMNQVVRLRDSAGHGVRDTVVVSDMPTAHYHAGGALSFGPDGMLYLTNGDALLPDGAARGATPLARIFRYTPDGEIPAGNPRRGDATWAHGLRNVQALAWLPDGSLLATDHGPSGMPQERLRRGHDELNLIRAGADYGWPRTIGDTPADGATRPLFTWETAIAPAGMARYTGPMMEWQGSVLVAGLHGTLERLALAPDGDRGWRVVARQRLLDGQYGRLRAVAVDAGGRIFLTTSNRDVRGIARPNDDLLLRLTPIADGASRARALADPPSP